jgi:hypothetical protein
MKKVIYILSIFTLIGACKRENSTPTEVSLKIPAGEWTWVQSSGGITGQIQTPDNQNITRRYLFTATDVEVTENTATLGKASYSITKAKSYLWNKETDFLTCKTVECPDCRLPVSDMVALSPTKDSLFLTQDANDGINQIYVKKRSDGFLAATYMGIDMRKCASPCCGGFLFNIEGRTYTASEFPAGFVFDANKKGQKLLLKTAPTVWSCTPIVVKIVEAKLK